MNPQRITPLILTCNESANIARTLTPLKWARQVVVLDSGSADNTVEIASTFPNVAVHQRPFDTHSAQWNHGLNSVQTEWVLALDADYVTGETFTKELTATDAPAHIHAFSARFIYCVFGRPLRGSLYPPRAVLFRRQSARYVQDGHTQLLQFEGAAEPLKTPILHDDRKPLADWLRAQERYARLEVDKLHTTLGSKLRMQDKLRKCILPAPPLTLMYCLLLRGLLLEGWPGWYYALQRTLAEMILSLHLMERKFASVPLDPTLHLKNERGS